MICYGVAIRLVYGKSDDCTHSMILAVMSKLDLVLFFAVLAVMALIFGDVPLE